MNRDECLCSRAREMLRTTLEGANEGPSLVGHRRSTYIDVLHAWSGELR